MTTELLRAYATLEARISALSASMADLERHVHGARSDSSAYASAAAANLADMPKSDHGERRGDDRTSLMVSNRDTRNMTYRELLSLHVLEIVVGSIVGLIAISLTILLFTRG